MKKSFDLTENNKYLWRQLVSQAIEKCDLITFNILYQENHLNIFLQRIGFEKTTKKPSLEKYYTAENIIEIKTKDLSPTGVENLKTFDFWQNKPIEDPSFWKDGEEILATISHENQVMLKLDEFSLDSNRIELFDLD